MQGNRGNAKYNVVHITNNTMSIHQLLSMCWYINIALISIILVIL